MISWIETTFNVSGGVTQTIAVILALLVVLLLFSLFVFILRRLMGSNMPQSRSRQPRIAVMDSATVDTKRRLVLIRRDNIEHLLLIGGPSDVVVEQHIVRNAPLTGGRPGTQVGAGQTAPAPLRAPTAPGPDIPVTPNDSHLPSAPSAPTAPATPPQPPASFSATENPKTKIAPLTAQPATASAPEKAIPVDTKPVNPFTRDRFASRSDASKTDPGKNPKRAADLLRAATQNGFNRAKTPQEDPDPEKVVATPAENPTGAPAIKPEPAAVKGAAPAEAKTKTSKLKSLTRPFTSRERPNYGSHSITPPASGPAARAKTALSTPVENSKSAGKTEPTIGTPPENLADTVSNSEGITEDQPPESASSGSDAVSAVETQTLSTEPQSADAQPSEATAETSKDASDSGQDFGPSSSPVPETAPEANVASKELNLELDVENLIFDETSEERGSVPANKDTSDDSTPQTPGSSEAALKTKPKAPEVSISEDEPNKPKAPDVKGPGAQPKAPANLADKNPIEDEMAKILDELVGQPN